MVCKNQAPLKKLPGLCPTETKKTRSVGWLTTKTLGILPSDPFYDIYK